MLHATTWESCPAELLLSAAAPEDTGKDARLLEQLKQQNRRGLERVMKRYTAYVGTILRNVTRGQTTQEETIWKLQAFLTTWTKTLCLRWNGRRILLRSFLRTL